MSEVKELKPSTLIAVWDPLVRSGHWLLVLAFGVAFLTAEEEGGGTEWVHVWAGYIVGLIVVLRILWGFIGPRRARFQDFVCGPVTSARYLVDLLRGHARRYLGHSPAGGAMVVLLLLSLAATVVTGLMAYGDRGKGPLAAVVIPITEVAYADENEGSRLRGLNPRVNRENGDSAVGELHSALANITLALVILHVIGVGLASAVHHENLVRAMIDGRKRLDS